MRLFEGASKRSLIWAHMRLVYRLKLGATSGQFNDSFGLRYAQTRRSIAQYELAFPLHAISPEVG